MKTIADTAASPSTSREADEKAANAINNGDDEDYEMNEADTRLTRELYSEIRSIMDQDSVRCFHTELLVHCHSTIADVYKDTK